MQFWLKEEQRKKKQNQIEVQKLIKENKKWFKGK